MTIYIKVWGGGHGLSIYNNKNTKENIFERTQFKFTELNKSEPCYFLDAEPEKYIHIVRRLKLKI